MTAKLISGAQTIPGLFPFRRNEKLHFQRTSCLHRDLSSFGLRSLMVLEASQIGEEGPLDGHGKSTKQIKGG